MTIVTYETFDLVSEASGAAYTSEFPAASDSGGLRSAAARAFDVRPIRRWKIRIGKARPVEVQRLHDIWNRTRFGTLPMTWVHPDGVTGTLNVVFDESEFPVTVNKAGESLIDVTLREWRG